MGHVYIDLGANIGDTIQEFLEAVPGATVFGFEPNPRLIASLRERFRDRHNVTIYEAACWTEDGTATMYLGHDLSSTLIEGKAKTPEHPEFDIDYKSPCVVRTIDFASWLSEHCTSGDRICVKMDIEGAEYPVLQRLLDTGAMKMIHELRCEWHYNRYPVGRDEHARIKQMVAEQTKVIDWK